MSPGYSGTAANSATSIAPVPCNADCTHARAGLGPDPKPFVPDFVESGDVPIDVYQPHHRKQQLGFVGTGALEPLIELSQDLASLLGDILRSIRRHRAGHVGYAIPHDGIRAMSDSAD